MEFNLIGSSVRRWLVLWRQGLLCCLPGWLRRGLDPAVEPYVLELSAQGVELHQEGAGGEARPLGSSTLQEFANDRRLLGTLKGKGRALVVRVPTAWTLVRKVHFPAATLENLRQVIGFEMDRLTPFEAGQVLYDYRVLARDSAGEDIAVEVVILPRVRVAAWSEVIRGLGLRPAALDVAGLWDGLNLLPAEERPRRSRGALAVDLGLWGAILLALLLALAIPLWQKRQIVIGLMERVEIAREQASAVIEIRERVEKTRELVEFIPSRRGELRPVVEVLDGVARVLPDNTWLQQFEYSRGRIELRGQSAQASALIATLEGMPGFDEVAFKSPVVGAQGAERFHLGARLVVDDVPSSAVEGMAQGPLAARSITSGEQP